MVECCFIPRQKKSGNELSAKIWKNTKKQEAKKELIRLINLISTEEEALNIQTKEETQNHSIR